VAELDDYLKNNGWVIITKKSQTNGINLIDSINGNNDLICYFALSKQLNLVKNYFLDDSKGWLIDEFKSPVIQFRNAVIKPEENLFNSGRLYYKKQIVSENSQKLISQNEEFLKMSEKFFNWYKRHFKYDNLNAVYTTKKAAELYKSAIEIKI